MFKLLVSKMRSRLSAIALALGPGMAVRTSGCAVGGGVNGEDELTLAVATVAGFADSLENALALILQAAHPSRLGRQFQRKARDLSTARCILAAVNSKIVADCNAGSQTGLDVMAGSGGLGQKRR